MRMDLLGIQEEIMESIEYASLYVYIADADQRNTNLSIYRNFNKVRRIRVKVLKLILKLEQSELKHYLRKEKKQRSVNRWLSKELFH